MHDIDSSLAGDLMDICGPMILIVAHSHHAFHFFHILKDRVRDGTSREEMLGGEDKNFQSQQQAKQAKF